MSINSASGAKFYIDIDTTAEPANQAAYEALTYVEVGEVEDLGEFGDESQEITFTSLGDGRVRKLKGPRDAGTFTVVVGDDPADAGQEDMVEAEAEIFDYAMKIELNDKLNPTGTNSIFFFMGKVMSKRLNVGNATNVVRRNFTVGINTDIIEVLATAGT